MLLSGIIAALTSLLIPIIILLLLLPNACYVVEQQHAVIIERLGKFNRIVNAGFHMKVPVIDRKAATVSLRTMKNGFGIDVKTQDNVTIGLEVSAQYHVSYDMGAGPADSGIYKSYYMLQEPVDQMRDFITDALRSSIPVYTLDEVFAKKDDIAKDVNATVSEQMAAYGFTLVSTLITKIALPTEVENSMNDINAAQRKRAAAQELAEADRIKRVTEATAEAEAMEKKAEAMAKYGKAAMTEMIIKVLPQMAEAIAKPLESIDKVTIIDGGSGENGVGTFSGNVPSVLAKTIESIKETTGFDLTEVMKANTYDAKTTKNVNFTGLPEEMSAAAKEPETDGKTE